ncbi:MAG: lipopolysaccharide biosynthesis protein [Agathobacter sp.]|nr:lipopolysaccharide biosynthesis protein [Agathobacter sp.]
MSESIGKNLIWKLLERFGVSGVQFVLQIVLARLLGPDCYGVLSILLIFTALANVFVQTGFNTSLIQNKDVTEEDYSSVFWTSLVIAAFAYIIIFLSAPYISKFFNMPEIIAPLRVIALVLFPGALNAVQIAKVSREMNFKIVFYSGISGAVISGIVSIIIAYMGGEIWALVAQSLVNQIAVCIIMYFTINLKIQLVCDLKRIRELFSYGWKLMVSALLNTFCQELSSLVIGKKYTSTMLGYYNRGKQFPQYISSAINGAVQSVMLPAMAAKQDDKVRVKDMTRSSVTMSMYVVFPIMMGLAAVAPAFIKLILTEAWLPCVIYMQIFCFSFAFIPVQTCNLQAINAMGRSDIFLKLEVIKKIYSITILVGAVFFFDSPLAIAMTELFSPWIGWFINAYPNKKLLNYSYVEQVKDLIPSMLMTGVMFIVVMLVGKLQLPIFLLLIAQIITGVVVYAILSIIFKPAPFSILLQQINHIVEK